MPVFRGGLKASDGGLDGVRTRANRVKSPALYLTELQALLKVRAARRPMVRM
jgi:hypothetical protein